MYPFLHICFAASVTTSERLRMKREKRTMGTCGKSRRSNKRFLRVAISIGNLLSVAGISVSMHQADYRSAGERQH